MNNQHSELCPCCKQPLIIHGIQPAFVSGRPPKILVHCLKEDCPMILKTCFETEIMKNWSNFGNPVLEK